MFIIIQERNRMDYDPGSNYLGFVKHMFSITTANSAVVALKQQMSNKWAQ